MFSSGWSKKLTKRPIHWWKVHCTNFMHPTRNSNEHSLTEPILLEKMKILDLWQWISWKDHWSLSSAFGGLPQPFLSLSSLFSRGILSNTINSTIWSCDLHHSVRFWVSQVMEKSFFVLFQYSATDDNEVIALGNQWNWPEISYPINPNRSIICCEQK